MGGSNKPVILVTGGAGFIGSFLVDRLVGMGWQVRILDNLDPQVHQKKQPPAYLNKQAEFVQGDVCDRDTVKKCLQDVEAVFHMASCVGVGQSQYEIHKYTSVNCGGTAQLWDVIVQDKLPVKKVIIPGSMTCFGEGVSQCEKCGIVKPKIREESEISPDNFLCRCPACGSSVTPVATPGNTVMEPGSVYAISKKVQEELSLTLGKTYNIPTAVLRYFNVYGPRQSLSNPYTGVSAIFISRIKNGHNPVVYEDGKQTRDFISVHDVVSANIKAMETDLLDYKAVNLGSGVPMGIAELGERLIKLLKSDVKVEVTGKFRKGDIRHCYADRSELESALQFTPEVSFEQGMLELAQWSENETADDQFEKAAAELKAKGLV